MMGRRRLGGGRCGGADGFIVRESGSSRLGVPPARFPDRDSWYAAAANGIRRAQLSTLGIKKGTGMGGLITER